MSESEQQISDGEHHGWPGGVKYGMSVGRCLPTVIWGKKKGLYQFQLHKLAEKRLMAVAQEKHLDVRCLCFSMFVSGSSNFTPLAKF